MKLQGLVTGDGLAMATYGHVFISQFYAPVTVARLGDLATYQRDLARTVGKHAVLSLVDPRVGREMSSEAREASRQLGDEMKPHTIAIGFAVLGTGFFAALARSVIAGIQFMSRPPFPWDVFSDVPQCTEWLCKRVVEAGHPCTVEGLQAAVDEVLRASQAAGKTSGGPEATRVAS